MREQLLPAGQSGSSRPEARGTIQLQQHHLRRRGRRVRRTGSHLEGFSFELDFKKNCLSYSSDLKAQLNKNYKIISTISIYCRCLAVYLTPYSSHYLELLYMCVFTNQSLSVQLLI
jgi:hypothetical protein